MHDEAHESLSVATSRSWMNFRNNSLNENENAQQQSNVSNDSRSFIRVRDSVCDFDCLYKA